MAHLSIFGYPSFCEIFAKFEKCTLHNITDKYINDIFPNKYLPIRIKGTTTRDKYCNNLMTDGFAGIEILKLNENIVNPMVNIIDQYLSRDIYKLLILDEPTNIESVVVWSRLNTKLFPPGTPKYKNITILLYSVTSLGASREHCSGTTGSILIASDLVASYADCVRNSKHPVKRVGIQLSSWTGGQLVEITVYSKAWLHNSTQGNI